MSSAISRPLPAPPATQVLNSSTFKAPALDGSLSIADIYDFQAENSPSHPLFSYAEVDGAIKTITWAEAVRAIRRSAKIARSKLNYDPVTGLAPDADSKRPIVGLLAATDSITYYTTVMGLVYAGFIPFPISIRNSPAAVAHLIGKTGVRHIFVGVEESLHNLVSEALSLLAADITPPVVSAAPLFEDFYPVKDDEVLIERTTPDWNSPYVILHSSGSTAFPKPIIWTQGHAVELARSPYYGSRDLTGMRFACHSMPMYHGMGCFLMTWTASVGVVLTLFRPQSPAQHPTPEAVFSAVMASKSDLIFTVPSFVEAWSKDDEQIAQMAKMQGVMAGGGPLTKDIGDRITSMGVNFINVYGCTEIGMMSPVIPAPVGKNWQYFPLPGYLNVTWVPHDEGKQELIIKRGPACTPSVVNSTIDNEAVYATSDLLEAHPTIPGLWKVLGRTDDQIMHSTGEKTNPGPLEEILKQDPHVRGCLMFGRGQFQAGVLVEPTEGHEIDTSDLVQQAAFRNLIWPTVEKMNAYAPQHSRVFKELIIASQMILIASRDKPFVYTAKGTARRQALLSAYDEEIKALYKSVDESAQADILPPVAWDFARSVKYVRDVVQKVLEKEIGDNDDFFQHGCDSLQATWIRNTILRTMRESANLDTHKIPNGFVYEHPYVSSLASFLSSLVLGKKDEAEEMDKAAEMNAMVEKFTQNFPVHQPRLPDPALDTVLLTGTTGGLGVNVLAHLIANPKVARVYAVNRKSNGKTLLERQKEALISRGLSSALATHEKVVLVEADIAAQNLGVSAGLYEELQHSVTHIIHNAWRVDFKVSLRSFESNIRGLRNLVDLALSSPFHSASRVLFTSSIGVFHDVKAKGAIPETPVDAKVAVSFGYAESKWVGEKILETAAARTALRPVNIRVGQMAGGLNGNWTIAEWLPSLIRSSVHLGALPDCEGEVSWIPLDLAATAVDEFRHSSSEIVHLIHPRPVPWSTVFRAFSSALNIPLIPYADWIARLDKSAEGVRPFADTNEFSNNPALRLLDWFHSAWSDNSAEATEALGFPKLQTVNAKLASPTLADENLAQVGEKDVLSWVGYWKSSGFLPA
ncbi:acetyl-CoA synthetase-like protein [Dentipellis sp. KUC8613]|nr:acetyl-CoA synthetase-like protein [Dentipellis sp. KUC8613]